MRLCNTGIHDFLANQKIFVNIIFYRNEHNNDTKMRQLTIQTFICN